MRFVQDHGVRARQQIGESLVLERKIGEQQVMVHDDDVGGLCGTAGLDHVAAGVLRALLAQAVLASRGDRRPDGRLLRQIGELRKVAGLGHAPPNAKLARAARRAACRREQRALLQG